LVELASFYAESLVNLELKDIGHKVSSMKSFKIKSAV
jgi:hypothetical protein